jgi:hypothetical protein
MNARACLTIASVVLWIGSASALEWQVDSSTLLQLGNQPSPPTIFSETLAGSIQVPFDPQGGGFEAKAHTMVGLPFVGSTDFDVLAFTFAYLKPAEDLKLLKFSVGRVAFSEPTGLILNHPADGFKLALDYGGVNLSVAAGYTGFVNRINSGISMTIEDQNQAQQWFASRRMLGSVQADTTLFGGQKFSFSALAQQDLNPSSDMVPQYSTVYSTTQGGTLDTQYLTLKAAGPIVDKLFYEAFGTLGTGSTLSWLSDSTSPTGFSYQYKPIVSFLLGGSVTYFKPEWLNASFTARVLGASGDGTATSAIEGNVHNLSTLFIPITPTTLGLVFNPGLSNLIYYELGGTVKPIPGQPLVTGAKLLGFQRAVAGVVNDPGVVSYGPVWMGQELDLSASWPVYSDLNVTVGAGGFLPSSGTYAPSTTGSSFQYALEIGAEMSL